MNALPKTCIEILSKQAIIIATFIKILAFFPLVSSYIHLPPALLLHTWAQYGSAVTADVSLDVYVLDGKDWSKCEVLSSRWQARAEA